METRKFSLEVAGKTLEIQKNIMALQAHGSIFAKYGETTILATCVMSKAAREGIDYFPLMIDFEERYYAAGKIPGSFIKREGRASSEAILTGRLIDRTLRPLFNHDSRNDTQVVVTVLSLDNENDPDTLAIIAASCSLLTSSIPWNGPVGAVRIGLIDNQLVVNPTFEQRKNSTLDLVVSGTKDKINMIESGANEVPENIIHEALKLAQEELKKIALFQEEIAKQIGEPKAEIKLAEKDTAFEEEVRSFLSDKLDKAIFEPSKIIRSSNLGLLKEELKNYVKEKYPEDETKIKKFGNIYEEEIDRVVHENIIQKDRRPDGRKSNELRNISCEISILPRTHGSGFFMRGTTQALSILTLGSPGEKQIIDTMGSSSEKRFLHHYNFPAFSVGEIGPMRGPGRREIGHGTLAERALEAILPSEKDFPYTIRVVSEILSSNGSSSMASVCGASLAMMDGGVPIKKPAAGIAMGLMFDDKGTYKILTDIQGPEDHHGDMDFKVAGTKDGITAIQMDVKIDGITPKIAAEVLAQAKDARLQILEKMEQTISAPKPEISKYAPRIYTLQINPDSIGLIIGPGGKTIKEITKETGVAIDINDDGTVLITSNDSKAANKAREWIQDITREAVVGEIYEGKIVKIMPFGAFVEIFPGTDGLLHISEISNERIEKVEDVLKEGNMIKVKVKEINEQGKISLSHKTLLNGK
ncbi:MAG: Polyribonucleotide nucleotidyltransferase [Candidatus Moranbacteria bacterium GW2011_GWF2_37_7]|nr:MAG: Polyribonucleotide nucleotidyltransferase [Candidatus Moranbacteria bacterium GW2011_GWF2_37_7]KKQ58981.1 MAG: Polyribonucleotide nucleotidyltransferase [Parcubacteria group bacterium GW2011_GWD1_38_16]